ncbi:amylo-alpha-1,6-glucosidase [Pelagibacterium limicola]|uniref:amylo-alpha-1,6-glucosidase n=1 Tax=Pelagibacterium limicola TaxID=2791022 RepID=UPI0018AFE785|nr:trehalase family glycosidase [Pelagibacterium limicola]
MTTTDPRDHAIAVLKENDRGTYTVPTKGLYPFQWNWDSCFTAIGQAHFDENRAWTEMETLFAHQWADGMVPHIIFHVYDDGYFPGPDVWRTNRPVKTSGITQPPVAGFALKRLYETSTDKEAAARRAKTLLAPIHRWHRWFYACRDPKGEGLVAIIHPWEAGRDNSVDWDEAFARVPTEGVDPYERRDLRHADPSHRPTKEQYDRYLWLVQHFRELEWDNTRLHDASPFQVIDPGFNAILIRSCADLADVADMLGETAIADENREWVEKSIDALDTLWSETHGQYLCHDRVTGDLIDSASIGGVMAVVAPVPDHRAASIARTIEREAEKARFIVPSHSLDDPRFDSKRYWRGPVWLVVNYLIATGLRAAGEDAVADHIVKSSLDLIALSGFAEYYDPLDGAPLGGRTFTWTAAVVLEFLAGKP